MCRPTPKHKVTGGSNIYIYKKNILCVCVKVLFFILCNVLVIQCTQSFSFCLLLHNIDSNYVHIKQYIYPNGSTITLINIGFLNLQRDCCSSHILHLSNSRCSYLGTYSHQGRRLWQKLALHRGMPAQYWPTSATERKTNETKTTS